MAVELARLYEEIQPHYDVKLLTKDCFDRKISWIHMVEDEDFAPLLHGDELVFCSGLNYTSEEWLWSYLNALVRANAGGLILSVKENHVFSEKIVKYCNEIRFPLFSASWNTPYVDIMRKFSEILLKNEQRESNLAVALKNAIYYPDNEKVYLHHFERNGLFRDMTYIVIILSCYSYDTDTGNERLEQIEKSLHYAMDKGIVCDEKGRLIILAAGETLESVKKEFAKICRKDKNVYVGIGTVAKQIQDIHTSYENAYTAYRLTKTTIPKNLLCYDELGVYKLLADVKVPSVYPQFVEETLGKLIAYDRKKGTEYMGILEAFFEHDCNILRTSEALYCHKNTLNYKMNAIKEILGYDIMCNENRVKIMLAFYILRLGKDYF